MKPFGFLLSLQAVISADEEIVEPESSRRRETAQQAKPIALYERDRTELRVFDRVTGKAVGQRSLKSYADALLNYHIHPESKFHNGDYLDNGTTCRRHVKVTAVQHIGKEANDWKRQAILGFDAESMPTYGFGTTDPEMLATDVRAMVGRWKLAGCARAFRVSAATIRKFVDNPLQSSEHSREKLASRMPIVRRLFDRVTTEQQSKIELLRDAVKRDGLRETA